MRVDSHVDEYGCCQHFPDDFGSVEWCATCKDTELGHAYRIAHGSSKPDPVLPLAGAFARIQAVILATDGTLMCGQDIEDLLKADDFLAALFTSAAEKHENPDFDFDWWAMNTLAWYGRYWTCKIRYPDKTDFDYMDGVEREDADSRRDKRHAYRCLLTGSSQ